MLDALYRLQSRAVAALSIPDSTGGSAEELLSPMLGYATTLRGSVTTSRPPRPHILNAALEHWHTAGQELSDSFSIREIRALCSEVSVLTSATFLRGLRQRRDCLQRRSLVEGVIRTYLLEWQATAGCFELEILLAQTVTEYQGPSRRINQCKSAPDMLFSPQASSWLAEGAVADKVSIIHRLEEWGIPPGSGMGRTACQEVPSAVVNSMVTLSSAREAARRQAVEYFIGFVGPVDQIPLECAGPLLGRLIQEVHLNDEAELRELLEDVVLASPRLGDPRLSANQSNWTSVPEPAPTILAGWLSKASLEFFFEEVLPDRKDVHGRREFWQGYLGEVVDCLVVLCEQDARRLADRLDPRVIVGTMVGSDDTSAFLMRFRGASELLVIEFSRSGNAIWFHDHVSFSRHSRGGLRKPSRRFHHSRELKNSSSRIDWYPHSQSETWQWKVRRALSSQGIRPR